VRLYLAPYLGQILLADLAPAHVQAMFTAISRQHEAMGRPVTTATLVRVKATLRAALNAAIRAGHITTNAAALRAHRAAQQAERASAGDGYHDSGYVFTRANGDPMAPDWLSATSASSAPPPGCRRSAYTTCATALPASPWPQART
jgi:hypothetical protein